MGPQVQGDEAGALQREGAWLPLHVDLQGEHGPAARTAVVVRAPRARAAVARERAGGALRSAVDPPRARRDAAQVSQQGKY
eukprot:246699-Prorocentrum_minimum.AAC.3